MDQLREQLAAMTLERADSQRQVAQLTAQMERLTSSDQDFARNVSLPDFEDREPAFKSFEIATKLANIQPFSGDRKRALAFCDEISRLLANYGQEETHEGFLYVTGRLAGDARLWYEFMMQTGPVDTWQALRPLLLAEYQSNTVRRDARAALAALRQTGTVQQYCASFRRIIMLLPDMQDEEKRYQFRSKLCAPMQEKISELEWGSVQDMMAKVQDIASRMDPSRTTPQAAGLAAFGAAPARPLMPAAPFTGVCWNCNSAGHRSSECPVPRRSAQAGFAPRGRGNRSSYNRGGRHAGRAARVSAVDVDQGHEARLDAAAYDNDYAMPLPKARETRGPDFRPKRRA